MTQSSAVIETGRNCWRIEHSHRLALIVDANDYFKAVKEAILKARRSVYLIGWDFDTRVRFEPDGQTLEGPDTLGPFLRWLDKNRPELHMHILKWDLGMIQTLGRGTTPLAVLDWMTSKRFHFRLDSAHPRAATHHQKIVVIDDRLAFCGGIDITAERWDTREHKDDDPRRTRPGGKRYGPWHDASTVVDGSVARALGELARDRWKWATGETLDPPPDCPDIWPSSVEPTFHDIDVAIARTLPEYDGRKEVREIEAFYLDAIAAAEHTIYCESQYFAAHRIAEAMARRLREKDGPEIIIVNPESADGFLESVAMDTARYRLLKLIRDADIHNRFRIYTPVAANGTPIYVHAKVMIVDDRLLRVGSSNFNNRSMGFDTECDLAIEASADDDAGQGIRGVITGIRDDLLAEHLDLAASAFRKRVLETGSLAEAIDTARDNRRTLLPYEPEEPTLPEQMLGENELLDPEQPPSWTDMVRKIASGQGWALR